MCHEKQLEFPKIKKMKDLRPMFFGHPPEHASSSPDQLACCIQQIKTITDSHVVWCPVLFKL